MTASRHILPPRRYWTTTELVLLHLRYPSEPSAELARSLGRSVAQVYAKASQLGLHKSDTFLAGARSGRVQRGRTDPRMCATQFAPGIVPWNKGTHYVAGGRSAEHRFKPGRPAHEARNWRPIGSLRVNADGYLERKLTDDPALYPARRWARVHHLVWEAAHGPVPAGHIVVFRPGRRTTELAAITADALECITRHELMRRNSVHAYGPEIARLSQLRGAITRHINSQAKAAA